MKTLIARVAAALMFALACAAVAPQARAANCASLPYALTNGTTADATQVMANFNSLQTCANGQLAHNGANADITALSALSTPITVLQGGTGSSTAAGARTNLGGTATGVAVFTAASQAAARSALALDTADSPTFAAVTATTFTGALTGNATNVTGTVAVANGGTGATTAAAAQTNLGGTTTGKALFTAADATAARATMIGVTGVKWGRVACTMSGTVLSVQTTFGETLTVSRSSTGVFNVTLPSTATNVNTISVMGSGASDTNVAVFAENDTLRNTSSVQVKFRNGGNTLTDPTYFTVDVMWK